MDKQSAFELKIDQLESRFAIAELGSAYCIACDDRDYDRLRSLFTPDIRIHSEDKQMDAAGIDNVMAMFDRMFSIRGPSYHWTHDRFVTFDQDDSNEAQGVVLAHAETTPHGKASIAAIRYRDRYRRVDGNWRFAERRLSFLYYMEMADFISHFPTENRMGLQGQWRKADYPEALPTWPKRKA